MSRALPEWKSDNHDAAIPARVKLRIWERYGGKCQTCGRKCGVGGEKFDYDHRVPLCAGGEHAELNIQLLCVGCHKSKTVTDTREKSDHAKSMKKRLGLRRTSRPIPGSKASPWKKLMSGEVVKR